MKNTLRSLLALTLSAACLASPAQAQAQASPESDQRLRDQEVIQTNYLKDAHKAISGYFNTLGLKREQVKEGLTIPWVATTMRHTWINGDFMPVTHGFALATDKTASNGCPVFKIIAFDSGFSGGKYTSRYEANFGICP
ncbi:MAG: hypothetical protein EPN97_16580 [Alphaproteobacteria bacterium]|nr:MAG: hypothetical protein EPN97_16580 [Alphaproteobacteria bacterium]